MSDSRRRYLAIQRELGGNEVILSAPLGRSVGEDGEVSAVSEVGEVSSPSPPSSPSSPPNWRRGAPPIPDTPGLSVVAPPRGLMDPPPEWNTLEEVSSAIAVCRSCFLCEGRTRTVPGEGSPRAELLFVGEGPGQVEDATGRPFVGRAGELLTQIIEAIGLRREDVFIANAVKCRPPQNRKPLPDELAACWRYLERQIELLRPKVIVALGATAAETLLQVRRSLAELRGRVHSYRGIPLVVTYHPAALLRNPNWKKPTWDDIRIARQLLDR
ncbi:MAG TPA: uracil-DNA glycosylase [Gemmatimonadales bacterium]|nr:uracil-DNA glycosylase [Gemmatimonadales bacterium]